VLGGDADVHAATRRRVAGVFAAEAVARHREAIERIAAAHVDAWPRGRPFRLLPRVRALVDEVFAQTIVGARRAPELAAGVKRMLNTPGNPPLSVPGPDDGLLGRVTAAGFARRSARVRRLLADELARGDLADGTVLGAMRGLPVDAAVDEMLPLLMAGQEPPAAALTWLLDRCARSPELGAQVAAAPTSVETDLIRRETLRLRPAVVAVMRRLIAPASVAGVDLPAGVVTMVVIPFMHRDRRVWSAPEEFRPDRFADGSPSAYLPFGGGARRCLGEHLAHLEMDVVLPAVLRRLRLRALWPTVERMVVRGTVLVPHRSELVLAQEV
jgi:cytochrome P450